MKKSEQSTDSQRRLIIAGIAGGIASLASGTLQRVAAAATLGNPKSAEAALGLPDPENCGIDHVIVVMMENRSYDHMLGWVQNSNGIQAGLQYPDVNGTMRSTYRLSPDYQGCGLEDPPHGYSHGRLCVNDGAMDGFLSESAEGDTFPIGYYGPEDLPFYAGCAENWTICDNYHSGILASTQPNRIYMHCGQTDRLATGSGLPVMSKLPTIWDAAMDAGVSATYYFSNTPTTALWGNKYLGISRPISGFFVDAANGELPSISYVDPHFYETGKDYLCNDDHPFADVRNGQRFLNSIYNAVKASPQWGRTLLIINYDEWGGFFDHVVPPYMPVSSEERALGNDGMLGIRVPCILIGPRVFRKKVDSTLLEPNSILKFMEWRWGLTPMGVRSEVTNNLANLLNFREPVDMSTPDFNLPTQQLKTRICRPTSTMTQSMVEHANEVRALQSLARSHGFIF